MIHTSLVMVSVPDQADGRYIDQIIFMHVIYGRRTYIYCPSYICTLDGRSRKVPRRTPLGGVPGRPPDSHPRTGVSREGCRNPGIPARGISRIPGFPPRTARGSGPSRDSFNVNERFREARTFCMGARARLRACTSALCGARVTCARLRLRGARIGHVIIADRICRYSSFR